MSAVGRRVRPGSERGSAALELVGLLPSLGLVALLVVHAAGAAYAIQGATDAVRQAARARSLGQDPARAAQAALPGGLRVQGLALYGDGGVRLTVGLPRVLPIGPADVTRSAELPPSPRRAGTP